MLKCPSHRLRLRSEDAHKQTARLGNRKPNTEKFNKDYYNWIMMNTSIQLLILYYLYFSSINKRIQKKYIYIFREKEREMQCHSTVLTIPN